jgi:hypothetical protein
MTQTIKHSGWAGEFKVRHALFKEILIAEQGHERDTKRFCPSLSVASLSVVVGNR